MPTTTRGFHRVHDHRRQPQSFVSGKWHTSSVGALRMVFGGSPNPAGFSGFSDMVLTDLANEIAMSDYSPDGDYVSPTIRESHLAVRETEDQDEEFAVAIMPAFEVSTRSKSLRLVS